MIKNNYLVNEYMEFINVKRFMHHKNQFIMEGFITNGNNFRLIMQKSPLDIQIRVSELKNNHNYRPIESLANILQLNHFQYEFLIESIIGITI